MREECFFLSETSNYFVKTRHLSSGMSQYYLHDSHILLSLNSHTALDVISNSGQAEGKKQNKGLSH